MLPDTILRIANTKEFQWLLQPELKVIKDGLIYVEDKDCDYDGKPGKYRGYLNAQGQRQGVGIVITKSSYKFLGEWHEDKLHGIAKEEWKGGLSWWGEYKDDEREGFAIYKSSDGRIDYCQSKNGEHDGYAIATWLDGSMYRGEIQNGM